LCDLQVLDFDAKSVSRPIEIAWCGEDAVVMQWRNTGIVMVGPFGDWLNFPYDSSVHLVAEPDCCRIITGEGCEILQRILPSTVAIRSVGSTDPGALMFDAMEAFEEGDPKSDENIRSIAASNQLTDAVQACVHAAAGEFDISTQQSFLKAASYGKAFCPDADPTEFVDTARKLRVLNEVRKPSIGTLSCAPGVFARLFTRFFFVTGRDAADVPAVQPAHSRGIGRPPDQPQPALAGPARLRPPQTENRACAYPLGLREGAPHGWHEGYGRGDQPADPSAA
jgi:hypothetical protein